MRRGLIFLPFFAGFNGFSQKTTVFELLSGPDFLVEQGFFGIFAILFKERLRRWEKVST
jgi:hypothetical protein